jgi:L-fuculose-phosphate aldolase
VTRSADEMAYAAVLAAAKGMLEAGLTSGTSGNVSARLSDGRLVITASAVPYQHMTIQDLVLLDPDGAQLDGTRSPSSEKLLHLACYRTFPEVGAVLHSHPPYVTMFACARQPVPSLTDEAVVLVGGDVPVAAYAMSGSAEIGSNAAAVLADVGSALLASHGLVTIAADPAKALHQAVVVEHCAHVAWGARSLGGHVPLPPEVMQDLGSVYTYLRENH